jgi:hypothetical protein
MVVEDKAGSRIEYRTFCDKKRVSLCVAGRARLAMTTGGDGLLPRTRTEVAS